MITIIILSVVLVGSLYFNWLCWNSAKYWQSKYLSEKRAHSIDNLLSGIACGVTLFAAWLSRPRE